MCDDPDTHAEIYTCVISMIITLGGWWDTCGTNRWQPVDNDGVDEDGMHVINIDIHSWCGSLCLGHVHSAINMSFMKICCVISIIINGIGPDDIGVVMVVMSCVICLGDITWCVCCSIIHCTKYGACGWGEVNIMIQIFVCGWWLYMYDRNVDHLDYPYKHTLLSYL